MKFHEKECEELYEKTKTDLKYAKLILKYYSEVTDYLKRPRCSTSRMAYLILRENDIELDEGAKVVSVDVTTSNFLEIGIVGDVFTDGSMTINYPNGSMVFTSNAESYRIITPDEEALFEYPRLINVFKGEIYEKIQKVIK